MSEHDDYMRAYNHYKAESDTTEAQSLEMSGRAAKANLTITAGALVLSITFLGSLANTLNPTYLWALGSGWLLLIISLASTLWAQATSQAGLEWHCKWLNRRMENPLEERPAYSNPFWRWVKLQRNTALITCITGISLLALFAYLSAGATTTETNEQPRQTAETQGNETASSAIHQERPATSPEPAQEGLVAH